MDKSYQEKTVPVETFYIFVDSRYRDTGSYISPSQYVVNFENVFKNVITVELVHALYGRSGLDNEKYVNLHIEELSPNVVSNHNASTGAFTQLPFFNSVDSLYEYDKHSYPSVRKFEKPLMKLSKLSITFLDKDKRIFPVTEHILRFEVTCFRMNDNIEEWDNFRIISNSVRSTEPVIKKDPYTLLGISQGQYDLNILANAFKVKARELRKDGMTKTAYDELKDAFTVLAKNFKNTK
jgi:hypothetical protein